MIYYSDKKDAVQSMVDSFESIQSEYLLKIYDYEDLVISSIDYDDDGEPYINELAEFPMWGWCWDISDLIPWFSLIEYEEEKILLDLGFTVIKNYDTEEYWIGIDGAGFNFYDAYWIPLYDTLELKWHEYSPYSNVDVNLLRNVITFLHENEAYGDDWSKEIKCLDTLIGKIERY